MSLVIENGIVLTLGKTPEVLHGASIFIEDGLINRIVPKGEKVGNAAKRIDASGKLVVPGFINAHTHFYSSFARGLTFAKPADDFVGVLENLWWRLDKALNLDDVYYSALVALIESIRHGTTALIDHHASPHAVTGSLKAIERAVRETGVRACLCYELSDRDGAKIAQEGLDENTSFIRSCKANFDQMVTALFGLHASFTISDATLEKASRLGHDLDTGFHIHVAEAKSDQEFATSNFGMRVVPRLEKMNILGPQTIAAHCVHCTDEEIDILSRTHTTVVHNPQSNANNAVGIADILTMQKRGVQVGLGTDAMTTNMLEELRVALWNQHLRNNNPSVGFMEVANTLFANNPMISEKIFGIRMGELCECCAADIAIIDYKPTTPIDNTNFYGHLIFGASQSSVDTTIVNGKILMENHKLLIGIDEERINARSRECAQKLWDRM
jgi:putative selenium metabolism protein SsnA